MFKLLCLLVGSHYKQSRKRVWKNSRGTGWHSIKSTDLVVIVAELLLDQQHLPSFIEHKCANADLSGACLL